MLSLLVVQIIAALALLATAALLLTGRFRLPAAGSAPPPVATRKLLAGTMAAWLGGTLLAVLWPLGVLLVPSVAYHWPSFPDFPYSAAVQVAGIALGVAGGVLFVRAARTLGVHMTPVIQAQQGHRLVQEGPYRRIRHPVYTAIIALALGQTLLYLSGAAAVLTIVLVTLAVYRSRLEEELLSSPEVFGGAYLEYMSRTGRFLPRFGATRRP
jgi:protein-S-isoprenylcysteine O-methyltransferase Ste14